MTNVELEPIVIASAAAGEMPMALAERIGVSINRIKVIRVRLGIRLPKLSLVEKFWSHVDKDGPIVRAELGKCWAWAGAVSRMGYGALNNGAGKVVRANRVSWELNRGHIPNGLLVLHRCDNPPCCNPDHLYLGTGDDNTADKVARGRQPRGVKASNAKLTEDNVITMRRMYGDGMGDRKLARLFHLSRGVTQRILRRKTWAHIA